MVPLEKNEDLIPPGVYCYYPLKESNWGSMDCLCCPYLELKKDKPKQANGYCHFLEKGDYEEGGTYLLWDMVKECPVKTDWDPSEKDIIAWARRMIEYTSDYRKTFVLEWIEKMEERDEISPETD